MNITQLPNGYENEDLIVWMRTAAFPSFKKLYGRILIEENSKLAEKNKSSRFQRIENFLNFRQNNRKENQNDTGSIDQNSTSIICLRL